MNYNDLKALKDQLEIARQQQLKNEYMNSRYVIWKDTPYHILDFETYDDIKWESYDDIISNVDTNGAVKKFEEITEQFLRTMVENDIAFDTMEIHIYFGLICSEKCFQELGELTKKGRKFQITDSNLLESVGKVLKYPNIMDEIVPINFYCTAAANSREFNFSALVNYSEFIDSLQKLGYRILGATTFKDYVAEYSKVKTTQFVKIVCDFEKTNKKAI